MRFSYPLKASETRTYSNKIADYTNLTRNDKRILVNNFKEFHKYCFWHLNLPMPTLDQLFMGKELAKCIQDKDPKMLQAQRGLSKSLTAQLVTVWLLLRNKNEKIVVVSATTRRAESFTLFCLNLLKLIPLLRHLIPTTSDRSSGNKFDVAGRIPDDSPSVCAFGVTSAKTGSRATFIIYDDVEIPENSGTNQMREKLLAGIRDTANLGVAGVFRELAICTPQSSESVYNTLVDEDGFTRIIIPSEYPEDVSSYQGSLAKHILRICTRYPERAGTNTDKRLDMAHLLKQKVKGKARYKLQYMLDTTLSDAEKYPLKLSDLIVLDLDAKRVPIEIEYGSERKNIRYDLKHNGFRGDVLYAPRYISESDRDSYTGIGLFIDPAGRGKDEVGYAVVAVYGSKIFVLDFGGLRGGYDDDNLIFLAKKAKEFNVSVCQVESNFGDGSFAKLLMPFMRAYHPLEILDTRATSQKEKRIIETLEPIMMQHKLVIDAKAIARDNDAESKDYKFTYQISHITSEAGSLKHDDRLDAIEMGVSYWSDNLQRSDNDVIDSYRQELINKEIDEFMMEFMDKPKSRNIMDSY